MRNFKSVLIVEDDLAIQETLKHVIEAEGYLVFTAENGIEGLRKLEALKDDAKPCLVLVDFMMPLMNGLEMIEHMQDQACLAAIPVVMVSASEQPKGVKKFIKKPCSLMSILQVLDDACNNYKA